MSKSSLVETWEIHNRINLYLLEAVDEAHLPDVSLSKGRTVGEQFAHIHNVRLMWLKSAAPALLERTRKLEKTEAGDKERIMAALIESGELIAQLLTESEAADGRIKGFKPHVLAFLGYIISHESHHRGQIVLSLKQSGHVLDKKILYGLWEWGTR